MALFSHGKIITILQYFTDKFDDYWHINYPFVAEDARAEDDYLYFLDISRKALDYDGKFSEGGIYQFYGYDGKYHIHALELAQYSLACWLAWRKTGETAWLDKAILHCDWLVDNQSDDGGWKIGHKNPLYSDLSSPWSSAMAQGLGISSLIRAFKYTGENQYLVCAKKACDFLEVYTCDNGVKRKLEKGFIYEEYPRKKLSGVLNGHISAVFGIKELSKVDQGYINLVNKNIENMKTILPLYDCGYYSFYSLDGNVSSGFYHRYVVKQLRVLEGMDPYFKQHRLKFESYQTNMLNVLKALVNKIRYNL